MRFIHHNSSRPCCTKTLSNNSSVIWREMFQRFESVELVPKHYCNNGNNMIVTRATNVTDLSTHEYVYNTESTTDSHCNMVQCNQSRNQKPKQSYRHAYTHAGRTIHNPVDLIFDLLTQGSMRAGLLPWSMRLPSLELIARVVFLLELEHTDTQTQTPLIALSTRRLPPAWVMILGSTAKNVIRQAYTSVKAAAVVLGWQRSSL